MSKGKAINRKAIAVDKNTQIKPMNDKAVKALATIMAAVQTVGETVANAVEEGKKAFNELPLIEQERAELAAQQQQITSPVIEEPVVPQVAATISDVPEVSESTPIVEPVQMNGGASISETEVSQNAVQQVSELDKIKAEIDAENLRHFTYLDSLIEKYSMAINATKNNKKEQVVSDLNLNDSANIQPTYHTDKEELFKEFLGNESVNTQPQLEPRVESNVQTTTNEISSSVDVAQSPNIFDVPQSVSEAVVQSTPQTPVTPVGQVSSGTNNQGTIASQDINIFDVPTNGTMTM